MLNKIKLAAKKILYKDNATQETYIAHLRSIGVKIGDDCTIYSPKQSPIDKQYPWMISIGDHVRILHGVQILTHDYSWSVLKQFEGHKGEILGACGHVIIGNNVFIGRNAIITRNVTIGDNVIIGAGSVVTKDCESNSVYAGNPAKRISDIDTFYEKRKAAQLKEAKELACRYVERLGKRPAPEVFHEFFMLFCNADDVLNNKVFKEKIALCENPEQSLQYLSEHKPMFDSFEAFLDYCLNDEK